MSSSSLSLSYAALVITLCIGIYTQVGYGSKDKKYVSVMLLRLVPKTPIQLEFLDNIKNERQGLRMQFWRHPDELYRHVDVWLSKSSLPQFRKLLKSVDLPFEVLSKDIVGEIGNPPISMNNIEDYDSIYQKVADINSELRRLHAIYPQKLSLSVIGNSSEGRSIYSVHVHQNKSVTKPIVFILCGSHAREWLGIASCQYVLRKIVFDHYYDDEIKEMLNEYDIMMVPLLNPDGYSFTKKVTTKLGFKVGITNLITDLASRMWRKSRSKTSDERCRGVDINRNFNYRWGGGGSSPDPCEEIYCGPKPFSESESLALARYLYKIRRKLVSFIDIHTYGQLWMSPWGFTTGFPRDYVRQEFALKAIQKAIREKNGMTYKIGRSATTLYATSGDAIDWVYGRLGVIHTYGIELRPGYSTDKSFNGFKRSRSEIIPTAKDLIVGLKTLAFHMMDEQNFRY